MIYLKAIILAIVEGVTEFLPISSTGHMIILDEYVKLSSDKHFSDTFVVVIQLPAVLSVLLYFWRQLWPFSGGALQRDEKLRLWSKIVVAFLPAAIFGALLNDFIENRLFNPAVVAVALLVGGVLLVALERRDKPARLLTSPDITYRIALLIGLAQCLAMVPGTSRSAATIIGAMLLGASRTAAAEFSFFLAIPTMLGAAVFTIAKSGSAFSPEQWRVLAIGSVISFLTAFAVIAAFMNYIRRKDFRVFGYYRIILAVLVLIYFAFAR